jgi:dihydroorotase
VKPNSVQLFQQVRVLDPLSNTDEIADVLICEGKIAAREAHLTSVPETTDIIDAQGLILAPGLVDLYSHSGEPGHEQRETLSSLASAASAGGFTRVAILPNTVPVIDNPATVTLLQQKLASNSPHFYFWGALTQDLAGKQMAELADLATAGVVGLTDNRPLNNLNLLRRLLEYSQPLNLPIALVPTDIKLQGNGVMREGETSIKLGLPGNPALAESAAMASIIELAATTQTPVHLMRVSTARGVELIKQAKERELPLSASTTWMHLLLNTEAIGSYEPNLRLEPPLGRESDRLALIEAVRQGIIDAIAVDHSPYTYEEKTLAFAEAPPGAIGLELALPLLWQNLVDTGLLSALQLWQLLSVNPLLCLQQKPLSCKVGETAELVLFNPELTWQVTPHNLKSLAHNTPWLEREIKGKILLKPELGPRYW